MFKASVIMLLLDNYLLRYYCERYYALFTNQIIYDRFRMCPYCFSCFSSNTAPLPFLEGMLGTYKRVSCMGMEELLMLQRDFADKMAEAAGSADVFLIRDNVYT